MTKTFYPDDFEQFWRAYDAPANASKKMAYAAYAKATDLPNHPLLLKCVEAYNEFLKANSKPGRPYPKAHAATWLNQARYEGFIDRGEEILTYENSLMAGKMASVSASKATWPPEVRIKLRVPDDIFEAWFAPCTFVLGPPPEIVAPSRWRADWLLAKYQQKIIDALGNAARITYL